MPAATSSPGSPSGRKFSRNAPAKISPPRPDQHERRARRPPSPISTSAAGRSRRIALVVAAEVDEQQRRGRDHAALEAAAGRQVPVGRDVDREQHRRPDQRRGREADRRARRVGTRRAAVVVERHAALGSSSRAQQQREHQHRGEQDELLAERVEGAVVEVDRRHDRGRAALLDRDVVHDLRRSSRREVADSPAARRDPTAAARRGPPRRPGTGAGGPRTRSRPDAAAAAAPAAISPSSSRSPAGSSSASRPRR